MGIKELTDRWLLFLFSRFFLLPASQLQLLASCFPFLASRFYVLFLVVASGCFLFLIPSFQLCYAF